jgi:AcrR family transcriptional regulator
MARAKTKEKRSLIMETAKKLFAEKGAMVSMSEIAREVGIPVGSIYTYFESKQILIETIIEEGWNEFRQGIEASLDTISHAEESSRAKALRALAFFLNRALPELFSDVDLIMLLLMEAGSRAKLEEKLQYIAAMLANFLAECAALETTAIEPRLLNTGITVMLLGALETLRISAKTDIDINARDIQHFLRQVVENALGQPLPDMD